MFNLEKAIADWRIQMQAGGLKTPVPLEELEVHLRDGVGEKMRAGLDAQTAFASAVGQVGPADVIRAEFKKARESRESRLVKVLGMAGCSFAGLFSMLMGINFLLIDELSVAQRLWAFAAVASTIQCLFSGRFSHRYLPVIHNRRVRLSVGAAFGVAGLVSILVFGRMLSSVIIPHVLGGGASAAGIPGNAAIGLKVIPPDGFHPMFVVAISLLWAFALMAVLGSVAFGLEEAARRRKIGSV